MFKNYVNRTFILLQKKKLYSAISLFVISFTFMIIILFVSVIEQFLSNNYPETNNKRLLVTSTISINRENNKGGWSDLLNYSFIQKYLGSMKIPECLGSTTARTESMDIYHHKRRKTIQVRFSDYGFWSVMNFSFVNGRPFNSDEVKNEEKVAVISQKLAEEIFSSNPVGKNITIYNQNFKICGVVKNVNRDRIFSYADVWFPITLKEKNHNTIIKSHSNCLQGNSVGLVLLKSKSDINEIKNEFNLILNKVQVDDGVDSFVLRLEPTYYVFISDVLGIKESTFELLIPVVFIFLFLILISMPSLNLYSLQKVRFFERGIEIGVKKAFGASSKTLKRQLLIENITFTFIGSIIGFVLAIMGILIINYLRIFNAYSLQISISAILICLVLCVLFGAISGLTSSRKLSKLTIVNALNLS